MKPRTAIWIAGLFLAGAVIATLLATAGQRNGRANADDTVPAPAATVSPVDWTAYAERLTPPANQREAENVPIYPNAEDVKRTPSRSLNQPDELSYFTNDSLESVAAFYSTVLPKLGWEGSEPRTDLGSLKMFFSWADKDGTLPYKLVMPLTIFDGCQTDPNAAMEDNSSFVDKRCIEIVLFRKPHVGRVPLLNPIGTPVVTDKPREGGFYFSRTTQYTTSSSPAEIDAFYMSTLQEYGWVPEMKVSIKGINRSIDEGILFLDPTMESVETTGPRVVITAHSGKDGLTKVTLAAEGPEFRLPEQP
jgi:hypothetical protein